MPGKHNAGGCKCCGVSTCVCDSLSYFTISGLANAACTSGCNGKNGTYVFRSGSGGCSWSGSWGNDNCGTSDGPYIGSWVSSPCLSTPNDVWSVGFSVVSGKLRVTIGIIIKATNRDAFGFATAQTSIAAIFQADFNSCADAVGATLPLFSSTTSDCSLGGVGDFCGLLGATITIG